MIHQAIYNSIYEITGSDKYISLASWEKSQIDFRSQNTAAELESIYYANGSVDSIEHHYLDLSAQGLMIRVGRSSFDFLLNKHKLSSLDSTRNPIKLIIVRYTAIE